MRHLKTFSTCFLALALYSTAWAEIYETTDAEGNKEFTDSPAGEDAEVVDLQQTNIADAPPAQLQEVSRPATVNAEQAPVEQNNTVIIHDGNDNDEYGYPIEERALRRDRANNEIDSEGRNETGDSEAQMPREVGDSEEQMPREVGDSEAQMPHEVGDVDTAVPRASTEAHRR